jgi:hypothetical protein
MDTFTQRKIIHDDDDDDDDGGGGGGGGDVPSDLTVNLLPIFGPLYYSFTC